MQHETCLTHGQEFQTQKSYIVLPKSNHGNIVNINHVFLFGLPLSDICPSSLETIDKLKKGQHICTS